jgi:serine/threonine-protein kinase HipA
MRQGKVFYKDDFAGILEEDANGVSFTYDKDYLKKENAKPVSLTMPLGEEPYKDKIMLPFFDGLILEGWLLDIAEKNWKINPRDRMGLLLALCRDCIGAASIIEVKSNE